MRVGIECAHEKLLDGVGRKAARGQADGMNHNQPHPQCGGSSIGMR